MKIDEAKRIMAGIPAEQQKLLADAHNRYMHFAGVWCGDGFSEEQIVADRAAFPHLLKYTEDGRPAISDVRCAEFMAAVSGLPAEWCMAYDEVDFVNEHGSFDELVAEQKAKAEREKKLALSAQISNEVESRSRTTSNA